jgi:molecular chaperone GrpE
MSNQDDLTSEVVSGDEVTKQDESTLLEQIKNLELQLKLAGDRELLARADYENLKRRSEKEREEVRVVVKHVILVELLPVLDSLKSALDSVPNFNPEQAPASAIKWLDGLTGINLQLTKALSSLGIEKIDCVGKPFDPQIHEAVRQMVGETDGMVVEELQTGYTIDGKLLRPSQVVVSQKL